MNDDDFDKLYQSIKTVGTLLAEEFVGIFAKIQPVLDMFYEGLWIKYRSAGMPYGETDEGMFRWNKEICDKMTEEIKRRRDG